MAQKTAMSVAARRWRVGGAVAVLAIGALGLTILALQHVQAAPSDREVAPVPTFSQPAPVPTAQPTPSATPDVQVPSYNRSQERFLAVGDGVFWRGVAGACGSVAPQLERSTNGGETWTDVTPTYLGIGQLTFLSSFADSEAEIVASMGADCEVQALRTFTQGQFWEPYRDVLAGARYVDTTDAGRIVAAGSTLAAPCADARNLSASGNLLAIVCDGTPYVLRDDAEWDALPKTDVSALTVSGSDVIVANVVNGCAGLTLTRYADAAGSSAEALGCVAVADPSAAAAVAISGEDILVWSGDEWIVAPA